jgi:hypothetical protein
MTNFQETIESYSKNRRELDDMLTHLIKALRTYRAHKNINRRITTKTSR